jgi:hypothetical protein
LTWINASLHRNAMLALSPAMGERAMKSIKMSAAAALVIVTAVITTASAQNQTAQQGPANPGGMMGMMGPGMMSMMGPGMMGPGMMGGTSGPAMCTAMAGHIEGRLAYLKAELKISEALESLWNTYAAAARDNTNSMLARCTAMMNRHSGSTVSLPDQLDQNEQLMAAHLDAMRAMNKALKPLYAALNESQKQTADQLFRGPMGMM